MPCAARRARRVASSQSEAALLPLACARRARALSGVGCLEPWGVLTCGVWGAVASCELAEGAPRRGSGGNDLVPGSVVAFCRWLGCIARLLAAAA
jgi:hypothetical protein